MTNLFYVHSALTEKIARAVSAKVKGPSVVISQQRYKTEWAERSAEEIYDLEEFRYHIFKNWGRIWRGDRAVSQLTGGTFHLYAPQTAIEPVRLLLSHRHCDGFSIFEEGLMSYCTREQMNTVVPPDRGPVRRRIGYLGRLGTRTFCREGYDTLYVVQEEAFPDRTDKEVVPVEFGDRSPKHDFGEADCILVLESINFYDKKTSCIYLGALIQVLKEMRARYETIYYKLHPDSYGGWQEPILKRVIDQFAPPATEIDRSANVEDVAIHAGVDVVLNISSTGLYCGLFSEGSVYSFHDVFVANYPVDDEDLIDGRVSGISDWIPDIFWSNTRPFMEETGGTRAV